MLPRDHRESKINKSIDSGSDWILISCISAKLSSVDGTNVPYHPTTSNKETYIYPLTICRESIFTSIIYLIDALDIALTTKTKLLLTLT